MNKITAFDLLRSEWMIMHSAIDVYRSAVVELLAGKEISTGLFSKLQAPEVPASVAMVTMAGVLTKADVCGAAGTRSMAKQVTDAANDPSIQSILLYAENCPGGQVDGTYELAEAVTAAKKKKPVIGMISGMNCSAGVWVLSGATEVYSTAPTDMVGCIGVVARIRRPKSENDQDFVDVYSDQSPDKNSEFRDPQALKSQYLNPVGDLFHQAVKSGRGEKLNLEKENVLSGKTYVAGDAKKYGLIDGIMPMNKVIARAVYLGRTFKK